METERRSAPRVELTTKVRVEMGNEIRRFTSLNLSSGGIFLETDRPLERGSQVALKFEMPGAGKVEAQGVVKHHTPLSVQEPGKPERWIPGMGIAFLRIEGVGAQRLADEIKKLSLKPR